MTVKPPGGPVDGAHVPADGPCVPAERTPGETFADAASGTHHASPPERSAYDPIVRLAARVRDGTLSVDQAIDVLVDGALEDPVVATLSAERRQALRQELKALFVSDPVLAGLSARLRQ